MVAVKYDDISLAFDFVSYAAPTEHNAYVSLDTGKIYWTSDASDAFDEEIPEDLETSDRYLAIPHKNELDLGRRLALRFVAQGVACILRPRRRLFPAARGLCAFQGFAGA